MRYELLKRSLLIWAGLLVLGFVNGTVREVGIRRLVEEPWAHIFSAGTAFLMFSSFVYLVWPRAKITSQREAAAVGALWFFLTLLTETFVLNRWMSNLSWEQILQSYDLTRGELWPVVLLWVGLLPLVMRAWRGPSTIQS